MENIYIGFTNPNQNLWDKYARHSEGQFLVANAADCILMAYVSDGYISGGMHAQATAPNVDWWLRLCRIDTGAYVDVATGPVYKAGTIPPTYAGLVGDGHYSIGATNPTGTFVQTGFGCKWTIKRGQYPDGNYEVTSNLTGTRGFTLQIRNSVALGHPALLIPPSRYVVQRPTYMPAQGGFPFSTRTKIIEVKDIRSSDTSTPVPFIDAGVFTRPFLNNNTSNELWSESFGTNIPDYDGCAWPSTSPLGGLHYLANQRYVAFDYATVAPDIDGFIARDSSPAERLDGGPGTGGLGVTPSGFRHADGSIYLLASSGSIIKVDPATRAMKTIYGWVKKPGTPQPGSSWLLPAGAARVDWLKQFFDFIGTGPTIVRAWQMCHVDHYAYVADCHNHPVVEVDLDTGLGRTFAGTLGEAGWVDGAPGVAKFNQPRGIGYLTAGPFAGHLVVADEHNSAYRVVNRTTGITTTLTRAKRVPTRFPGDFYNELSRKTNRITWGAPTKPDGTLDNSGKVQAFSDAQFCHPCHIAVLSDGKTVASVHHDEYRGFKLDLEARTLTHLFDFEAAATRGDVSPADWPTIHADTSGSMGWGIDTLWVCSWHHNNIDLRASDGRILFDGWLAWGTCGDHEGIRANAYTRAMIVLGDGSFIFNGDGQNSLCRVRRRLPSDPKIDRIKMERGNQLYRAEGPNRASLMTMNGAVGRNYLQQLKTPGELAMLSAAARKTYMVDTFGVTDWSDADHADVAYYLDCNCPLGVQLMRPKPPPPIPMSFDAAVALVQTGATVKRTETGKVLMQADVLATDWTTFK